MMPEYVGVKFSEYRQQGEFRHAFERAGLGIAPYKCVGLHKEPSCCAFCGTPILYCYEIEDSKGRKFVVGSDCVNRTGDAGLVYSIKTSPAVRKFRRDQAAAKDALVTGELLALLDNPPEALQRASAEYQHCEGSLLRVLRSRLPYCGMAGRKELLRLAKAAL